MHPTRRQFIKRSLGASTFLTFGGLGPWFLSRAAAAGPARPRAGDSVLVVVQLSGGNDGLNTVVPYEDDAYHRARPTLRLPANRVLKIGSGLAFHPDMPGFLRLFDNGLLSIVQGVGYPNSTRDHDEAKRDWHTARPRESVPQTGWVGRAVDHVGAPAPAEVPGVFVGEIRPPFGVHAERAIVPWVKSPDDWVFAQRALRLREAVRAATPSADNPLLDFLRSTAAEACASSARVEAVLRESESGRREYPGFSLARTLRSVAQLIRADLGIRIYFAEQGGGEIGGFDTHAGQAINHGALLRELSESVAAFVEDLRHDRLLDRVLVLVFSEFGRTLSENGRRGTDHGSAAPVFLAGGRLKTRLVGSHPSLTDLDNDAPKFHTDFRRVYATALDAWLGVSSEEVLGVEFAPLEQVLA